MDKLLDEQKLLRDLYENPLFKIALSKAKDEQEKKEIERVARVLLTSLVTAANKT